MELDPKYVDVIVLRWQQLTGKQATDENGRTFDDACFAGQCYHRYRPELAAMFDARDARDGHSIANGDTSL
jgi:hypothetical protein